MTLPGPVKESCEGGCGAFGTPRKATGRPRECRCEDTPAPTSTLRRTRIRQRSVRRVESEDDGWQDARAEALARTGGSCEIETPWCEPGPHPAVVVHHRLLRAATRGQGADRHAQHLLLTLCQQGHDYVHANPAESYERGWLLSRYG